MTKQRCEWCTTPLMTTYHDEEWGIPLHDDQRLFEMLILEGAQAGLSWETVLKKREHYRLAFDQFDPKKIAGYGDKKKAELLQNAGIIRNRLKIDAAILNAQAMLAVQETTGSFHDYLWQFVDHTPIQNHWQSLAGLPAKTELSDHISKTLKKRGFKFVGSTICYSFIQAVGMVNDHLTHCFRYSPPILK